VIGAPEEDPNRTEGRRAKVIARINIEGAIASMGAAGDHFGFVAEELGTVKIGGAFLPIQIGPQNDLAGLALGGSCDAPAKPKRSLSRCRTPARSEKSPRTLPLPLLRPA